MTGRDKRAYEKLLALPQAWTQPTVDLRLELVPFLIADHLDSDQLIVFVVQTFQNLSEGTFPDHLEHFEPVGNVVVKHLEEQERESS